MKTNSQKTKQWKALWLAIVMACGAFGTANAATFQSRQDKNWDATDAWTKDGSNTTEIPTASDDVVINNTITVNVTNAVCKTLVVNSGKTLQFNGNTTKLTVNGNFTLNGTLALNNNRQGTLEVFGNLIINNTYDSGVNGNQLCKIVMRGANTTLGGTKFTDSRFAMLEINLPNPTDIVTLQENLFFKNQNDAVPVVIYLTQGIFNANGKTIDFGKMGNIVATANSDFASPTNGCYTAADAPVIKCTDGNGDLKITGTVSVRDFIIGCKISGGGTIIVYGTFERQQNKDWTATCVWGPNSIYTGSAKYTTAQKEYPGPNTANGPKTNHDGTNNASKVVPSITVLSTLDCGVASSGTPNTNTALQVTANNILANLPYAITGTNAADFTITGGLTGGKIASGTNNLTIHFAPQDLITAGQHTATLTICGGGLVSPVTVTLTGTVASNCTMPSGSSVSAQNGNICAGTATNIQVSNSESGVLYALFNTATNTQIGSDATGDGSTISLPTGNLTETTNFTVKTSLANSTYCGGASIGTASVTVPVVSVSGVTFKSVLKGKTSTSFAYTTPVGSPTKYSIVWDSPALSAYNVSDANLTASPITVTIPSSLAATTYTGQLTVNNGTCSGLPISISFLIVDPCVASFSYDDATRASWVGAGEKKGGATTCDPISNMLNNSTSNRWSTCADKVVGDYFIIDMLQSRLFNQVVLNNTSQSPGDFPTAADLYVSDDNVNFTLVASTTGANPITTFNVSTPQYARYIKVILTSATGAYWSVGRLFVNHVQPTNPATAPSGFTSPSNTTTSVNLSWTAVANAISYDIYRCTGNGCSSHAYIGSATGTTYSDTGLTPNTEYSYKIQSVGYCGSSAISSGSVNVITCEIPNMTYTLSAGSNPICGNGTTTISLSNSQSDVTYRLYRAGILVESKAGTGSGFSFAYAADVAAYTVKAIGTGGSYCAAETAEFSSKVTITAKNLTISTPASASYAAGAAVTALNPNASGSSNYTYQWFQNESNSTTGGTQVGTGSTYTPTIPASISPCNIKQYYYVTVSADCGQSETSGVITITVTNPECEQPAGTCTEATVGNADFNSNIKYVAGPFYIRNSWTNNNAHNYYLYDNNYRTGIDETEEDCCGSGSDATNYGSSYYLLSKNNTTSAHTGDTKYMWIIYKNTLTAAGGSGGDSYMIKNVATDRFFHTGAYANYEDKSSTQNNSINLYEWNSGLVSGATGITGNDANDGTNNNKELSYYLFRFRDARSGDVGGSDDSYAFKTPVNATSDYYQIITKRWQWGDRRFHAQDAADSWGDRAKVYAMSNNYSWGTRSWQFVLVSNYESYLPAAIAPNLSITNVAYSVANEEVSITGITIANTGGTDAVTPSVGTPIKLKFEIGGKWRTAEITSGATIAINGSQTYPLAGIAPVSLSPNTYTLTTLVYGISDLDCSNNTKETQGIVVACTPPEKPNAGIDIAITTTELETQNGFVYLDAEPAGGGETGVWSVVSVPLGSVVDDGAFDDPADNATGVMLDEEGEYLFCWTVTNACDSNSDTVIVTLTAASSNCTTIKYNPSALGWTASCIGCGGISSVLKEDANNFILNNSNDAFDVDMKTKISISRLVFVHKTPGCNVTYSCGTRNIKVEISDASGGPWTEIYKDPVTGAANCDSLVADLPPNKEAQFLKITNEGANAWNFCVLRVYGEECVTCTTFTGTNGTVSGTVGDPDFSIQNPVTNNPGTPVYSSNNSACATIVSNQIHLVAAGTATITLTYPATGGICDGSITYALTVSAPSCTPFTGTNGTVSGTVGDPDFSIQNPVTNNPGTPVYSSDDNNVATIVSNKIHLVAAGTATITLTYPLTSGICGGSITYALTVNEPCAPTTIPIDDKSNWAVKDNRKNPQHQNVNNLKDKNYTNEWATVDQNQVAGLYVCVDMGSNKTFNQIILHAYPGSNNDVPAGWALYVSNSINWGNIVYDANANSTSNDPNNWGSPIATGVGAYPTTTIDFPTQINYRYFKIQLTASKGNWWKMSEIDVNYIKECPTCTPMTGTGVPINKIVGDADFNVPVVSTNNEGTPVYSSSNTSVATIQPNNQVHIVGHGTADIILTYPETNGICGDDIIYTLTVSPPAGACVDHEYDAKPIINGGLGWVASVDNLANNNSVDLPRIFDGNLTQRWQHGPGAIDQWIMVDMLEPTHFNQLILRHALANGNDNDPIKSFVIEISDDKIAWETVYSGTGTSTQTVVNLKTNPVVRYFRIRTTSNDYGGMYWGMSELYVNIAEANCCDMPIPNSPVCRGDLNDETLLTLGSDRVNTYWQSTVNGTSEEFPADSGTFFRDDSSNDETGTVYYLRHKGIGCWSAGVKVIVKNTGPAPDVPTDYCIATATIVENSATRRAANYDNCENSYSHTPSVNGSGSSAYIYGNDFTNGKWIQYSLDVTEAGIYTITSYIGTAWGGGLPYTLRLSIDGTSVGTVQLSAATGGWGLESLVAKPLAGIDLPAGQHVLRIAVEGGNSGISVGRFEFAKTAETSTEYPTREAPCLIEYPHIDTIVWTNAKENGEWSDRKNWFNPQTGLNIDGFTTLTNDLTVIVPWLSDQSKYSQYLPQGGHNMLYPEMEDENDLGDVKITNPLGDNYIKKLIVEYGGATYIKPFVNEGNERYKAAKVELVIDAVDRNEWILVGPHILPDRVNPMKSGNFYLNREPNVYMHELVVENTTDYAEATWLNSFTGLNEELSSTQCFAIKVPNDYGAIHLNSEAYYAVPPKILPTLTEEEIAMYAALQQHGTQPITYTWDNTLLANKQAELILEDTHGDLAIVCNTFLSNISVEKLFETGKVSEVVVWNFRFEPGNIFTGSAAGSFTQISNISAAKDIYIKPMQAFMYISSGGTLDESDICVVNISTRYKARSVEGRKPTLKVNAYSGAYGSEGYLIYNDELPSSAYDSSKDFKKLFTGSFYSHVPELYFELDGKLLHTQSFASLSNEINLGIRYGEETGTATLKFTGADEFDAVYLEDKATGETYDLNTVDSVNVDITQGYNAYRFIIKFTGNGGGSITGDNESWVKDSSVKIYTEDNRHVTVSATDKITEIRVLSTNGQLILTEKPKSATYATIDLGAYSAGIYVVKVITAKESASAKVVIK